MSAQWERPMVNGERCEAAACVEIAPIWETSALSAETSGVQVSGVASERCEAGNCVEVSPFDGGALVRDSKLDESPVLRFTRSEWKAFREAIKAGQFAYDEQRESVTL